MPKQAPETGRGRLTIARTDHPVDYNITFSQAVDGRKVAKGMVEGDPEVMRSAFKEGLVDLTLESGTRHYVMIIAHAQGDARAFFESRGDIGR